MTLQAVPLMIPLAADGVTQVQHPSELFRALARAISPFPGVVNAPSSPSATNAGGDFAATVVPAAMQLTIAKGAAFLPGRETASTLQQAGAYFAYSEASETISWPANSSGSTRMDSLILRVADPQYGSIGGSPLGAWWDPVVGSSGSARPDSDFQSGGAKYIPGAWLRMYDISVPNGATQLTQGNVAFKAGYSNCHGFWPYLSAGPPSVSPLSFGQPGLEVDTGRRTMWTGATWAPELLGAAGIGQAAVTSGTDTTTSASYVNMAGTGSVTSFSFTKYYAFTRVDAFMHAGIWSATSISNYAIGLLINGTDYEMDTGLLAANNATIAVLGRRLLTGIPAGTYTVQCRWRRVSGSGTPSRGTSESLHATLIERY